MPVPVIAFCQPKSRPQQGAAGSTTQGNTSTSLMPSSGFASPLWGYPDVSRRLKMKSKVYSHRKYVSVATTAPCQQWQSVPVHSWNLGMATEEVSGSFPGLTWPVKWWAEQPQCQQGPLQDLCSRPFSNFLALLWTRFSTSVSFS